jgi:hypothetical protein
MNFETQSATALSLSSSYGGWMISLGTQLTHFAAVVLVLCEPSCNVQRVCAVSVCSFLMHVPVLVFVFAFVPCARRSNSGMMGGQLCYILGIYYANPNVASIYQPAMPVWARDDLHAPMLTISVELCALNGDQFAPILSP